MAAPSSTESRSNYLTQQIIQPETTDDAAHQKLIHSTGDEENNNTFYIQERFLRETTRYFSGLEKPLKCGQKVNTLEELIEGLHREFSTNYVNVKMVNHLMLSYQSNAKEWQKFAKFDRYKYTRNLVDAGNGRFNLMILCWGEGHGSTIHDHSDAHCFMKILKGELREIRYDMPEAASADIDSQLTANNFNEPKTDSLTETRQTIFGLNDVAYINGKFWQFLIFFGANFNSVYR